MRGNDRRVCFVVVVVYQCIGLIKCKQAHAHAVKEKERNFVRRIDGDKPVRLKSFEEMKRIRRSNNK